MTTVSELQETILGLSESDYSKLRRWLLDQDWEQWEREFDEDAKAGKLDGLAAEAFAGSGIVVPDSFCPPKPGSHPGSIG